MTQLSRRILFLLNRRRLERELADDMAAHREMAAQAGGMPFGNVLRLREEAREAWGWMWIDRCGQDLRYAARLLRRSPGFTLAAVLMLAIGVGVNVAAFGFFNLAFLKPLPVRDPDTLLRFQRLSPDRFASNLPYPEVAFFREGTRTLSAVLGLHRATVTLAGHEKPLNAHFVTDNFFSELGAAARVGRLFVSDQDSANGDTSTAVLSHGFWQRQFAGDPLVVGRTLRINDKPVLVSGVAASGFIGLGLEEADLWLPIAQHPYVVGGSRLLEDFAFDGAGVQMWGRMRPGVTSAQVEDELRALAATLRLEHPDAIWADERLPSEPGAHARVGRGSSYGTGAPPSAGTVYAIVALAGTLVLLILAVACANLGSLLLARGATRGREISIRVAIGAGRARLVRQLFTESLLLGCLGAAVGLVLGQVLLRAVLVLTGAPDGLATSPDWRVALFAIVLTLAATVLFGLAPALQVARQRHQALLMRQILIGGQVAASCVLLIVAALLGRALERMISADPGYEYQRVLSISPGLAAHGYSPARATAYFEELERSVLALPGVASVAVVSTPPLGRKKTVVTADIDGRRVDIHVNEVAPTFLETMGIPLVRGRNLLRGETRAIVVSESMARVMWPAADPLGQQFDGRTVVGVARSARQGALQDPDAVEAYLPLDPSHAASLTMLVKGQGPAEGIQLATMSAARALAPDVFPEVQLLKTSFGEKVRHMELSAAAVGLLGCSALLLACMGVVGLVAYSVAQRTKEIGIRLALGATGPHILGVVAGELSRPVAAGLLAGVVAAAGVSQVLRRELYGVSSLDPAAYLAAIAVFVCTVALAAIWPARRALGLDPLNALRCD